MTHFRKILRLVLALNLKCIFGRVTWGTDEVRHAAPIEEAS